MSAGLVEAAQRFVANLLELSRTRFELFGAELREELGRLATGLLGGLAVLVLAGRRSEAGGIPWWPFASAGVVTGGVAELLNARFLVTIELLAAVVTGLVIGTAHWVAVRVWIGLGERPPG